MARRFFGCPHLYQTTNEVAENLWQGNNLDVPNSTKTYWLVRLHQLSTLQAKEVDRAKANGDDMAGIRHFLLTSAGKSNQEPP